MVERDEVDEIIAKELHEAGDWKTPWKTCTQCEDKARIIRAALREAGYVIVPGDEDSGPRKATPEDHAAKLIGDLANCSYPEVVKGNALMGMLLSEPGNPNDPRRKALREGKAE